MTRYSSSRSRSRDRSRDRSRSRSRSRRSGGGDDDDGYRVHVADLGVDCAQRDLEKAFSKFGEFREVWLARNPPCFAFVVYKYRDDAEAAIKEMNGELVLNKLKKNKFSSTQNFNFLLFIYQNCIRS
jgi:RNA recognition motif-containing protein